MSLAALIAAYQEVDAPEGGLRATLPLAGRTVIERQARLAQAAGAHPIVVLVERLTPDLLAAIDRVRAEGVGVGIARSAGEAAEAVDRDSTLLLMADGLIADEKSIARLLDSPAPALITLPDHLGDSRFERIDSQSLWAGLALLDGDILRLTAERLGDWDLQSTLLRRAVEVGARQLSLHDPAAEPIVIARRPEDLGELQRMIVARANASGGSWISRYVLGPVESMLTRLVTASAVTPGWIYIAEAAGVALGGLFFAKGWLAAGLILLLLATPLAGTARRLAMLRMQSAHPPRWWASVLPILSALTLAALGYALMASRGWGCLVLAAATIAFLVALRGELRGHSVQGDVWLAEPKGMAWILVPFAILGHWTAGLVALACYAAGSFFWAQHAVHRRKPAPTVD